MADIVKIRRDVKRISVSTLDFADHTETTVDYSTADRMVTETFVVMKHGGHMAAPDATSRRLCQHSFYEDACPHCSQQQNR